jgi:RNA polymerase sigma factor (sigma-70 family)
MATSQLGEVLRHLRRAALHDGDGQTDGQLLEGFVCRREGAALEALVRRHGPMVWGVCRRALRNPQDAEDAFQATFLVLVRKAASVVPRELVGNWLYGVAYQTAWKARVTTAKRRAREQQVPQPPEPAAGEQDPWRDLRPLLDQELRRLPARYRAAIVLCDLEGKTRAEASRQLGVPEGTLSGRLTRGRAMLAKRLRGHGLVQPVGVLASMWLPDSAPAALVSSTVEAAMRFAADPAAGGISLGVAALTEGVLNAMYRTKLRIVAGVLCLAAVIGLGVGGLAYPTQAQDNSSSGGASQQRRPGRLRWEYKALTRADLTKLAPRDSKNKLTDGLNDLGNDGWELVGIEPGSVVVSDNPFRSTATGGTAATNGAGTTGTIGSSSGRAQGGSLPSTYLFKRPR